MGDILLIEEYLPGQGFNQSDNHVESGGLSGPVWSKKANYFTAFQDKVYFVDSPLTVVFFYQFISCNIHCLITFTLNLITFTLKEHPGLIGENIPFCW